MMMRVILSLCLLGQVLAGPSKPEITIGLNSDAFDKGAIAALEPTIKWQTSGTINGCDVDVSTIIGNERRSPAPSGRLILFFVFFYNREE